MSMSHLGVRSSILLVQTKVILRPFFHSVAASLYFSSYLGDWNCPRGFDTGIKVYNSAIHKKVPLVLKNKDIATWYMCGPTVYAESHIGHASCYVKFDIIRRILEQVFGINVLLLLGITDIDDKIIKKSKEVEQSIFAISKKYESEFFNDMETMRIKAPTLVSRVTENIPLIISFCDKLIQKEYAYATDEGNVYFMVSKGVSADVLSELIEDNRGQFVDPLKKDHRDFALWKASKENEPFWMSPWGKGRPGWHIECSAMASKLFGCHLDLHSGGYDLLFPHHSNEKSQSEAYHGCSQWVNYWLHAGLLQVENDEKMSKSIKNTISVTDFLKDHSVNDFRILCLQSLYRKNISYCAETMAGAKGLHNKMHNFLNDAEFYMNASFKICPTDECKLFDTLKKTEIEVKEFLADDFNTCKALLCISDLIDEVNEVLQSLTDMDHEGAGLNGITSLVACSSYIDKMLETLGVHIVCKKKLKREFVYATDAVTEFRNKVRLVALCQDNQTNPSAYIEESYKDLQSKISLVSKELPHNFSIVQNVVDVFYNQATYFASSLSHCDLSEAKLKDKKNKLAPLFSFCDQMRSSLQTYGIALKDRKNVSTWLPLTTLEI